MRELFHVDFIVLFVRKRRISDPTEFINNVRISATLRTRVNKVHGIRILIYANMVYLYIR
jgi:hypothetical protein